MVAFRQSSHLTGSNDMAKLCFVIQGFGKKQDYEQGKQFDLDASERIRGTLITIVTKLFT
jgi:hypothetical protein